MRRRLVWAIAGVAIAAIALFAVPLGIALQQTYRDRDLVRLQRDTLAATRGIDLGAAADPIELPSSSDTLAVYSRSGDRLSGQGPGRAPVVVRKAIASGQPADATEDGRLVVAVPLTSDERVTGAVRAARSDASVERQALKAWLVIALIAATLVAAAAIAAAVLARRLAQPLERLAVDAGALGRGDFTARTSRSSIPEVDQVGTALDTTAGRLGDMIRRERQFSADASHQLRTPLAALRLDVEALILRNGATPELASALAQVDRLETTITTLLAVARDAPRAANETADVTAILREVAAAWHGRLAADARPLRVLDDDGAAAAASPAVIREILEILMTNAHAHGSGAVTIGVRHLGGALAIDVGDEGAGFPGDPELSFSRRGEHASDHGIGLSLARALAEGEGGAVRATRAAPHPVVTVLLPLPDGPSNTA